MRTTPRFRSVRSVLADDSGAATVASAGIITAVTALLLVVAGAVGHVVGSHRVQVAADLAAVAGATALYSGHNPCVIARHTAELNNASLTTCETVEADVVVTLTVPLAEATSRAGPL
ncbi:Rv3654c family TadE-like protein [Corynebacterium pilosum]|uniref:Putative secreted protein n=1 Tax=Corynebacterium pilosum TaxID=35756 RepID=A0A376CLZ7_9CORY|nr:Rv3654c family TadE-like protein [Corynebacterium pilosum]STC69454.1 putative secreted protein [Corynebacterium pilosum]